MKQVLARVVLVALLLGLARGVLAAEESTGPLADYVNQPDDSYRWVVRQQGTVGKTAWAELILTSQTWKDTVWRHQLFIIRPSELRNPEQAILLIDGGSWKDELAAPPAEGQQSRLPNEAALLANVAERVKAPVAVLKHVPQQPIFDGLSEDAAISFTFDQFLKTKDATWPLLLPMVKSAVRGMDAMQEFAREHWDVEVRNFTLTGASKRGWTTWLTASVDPRVNAFAPMVIDMLNMSLQMKHQVATFGDFSEQISDYTERGIQKQNETEEGRLLQAIVDPYSYRKLLTQPKLILLGTNDRYWPLDAANLYWNDLAGEKHILYIPNNGHGLSDLARITGTIAALHRQAAGQAKLARLNWNLTNGDSHVTLAVKSDTQPKRVQAWVATAATRDFRDSKWTAHDTTLVDGAYVYEMALPTTGYAALFGEASFDTDVAPYFLSTNVKIVEPAPAAVPAQ